MGKKAIYLLLALTVLCGAGAFAMTFMAATANKEFAGALFYAFIALFTSGVTTLFVVLTQTRD
ncbi:hypothetical protein ACFFTN_09640 [Aminobacter aganoensis]|uniref:Uncharacterized protein n=2 Tax=Aminobacter TaxID=31988 RepID=A0A7X0F873_9HYPH|nr:hypothetical protein [Aminobacter aganoensis]MBB6354758.1 hypothetical protein [Aminobacter aganoensis]